MRTESTAAKSVPLSRWRERAVVKAGPAPLLRLTTAIALAFPLITATLSARAQSAPPAGSPTDVTYTAPTGSERALYPRVPDESASPPQVLAGSEYAPNNAIGRLVVEVDRNAVPADGQSMVKVTVRVYGKDGAQLKQRVFITIEHSGGRVLLAGAKTEEFGPRRLDADRAAPGVQVRVDDGVVEFNMLAPSEAQDVRVRITAGAEEAAGVISFVPEMRDMIAAGLVEGIVNFRRRGAGVLQPVRSKDGFEQEIEAWSRQFNSGKANVLARTAFYLKGTVRGDLLLTAAYDSDKDTRARLLRDIRPDEVYPVYGDASLRSFDARSADRLYVRLDKNKSYLLYGDFVTGDGFTQPIGQGTVASLKQKSLGAYNRTATGVRAHHEEGALTASAFVFNDSLRQVVEEFASQGSGPYGLRNSAVLEGSEKVEVLVRDRAQPSRIVSVRPLQRLVDYSFEPFSGRILLATFLNAFDENLNPVTLRVTYEVDQGGKRFWVGGAEAQYKVNDTIEVGGSAVTDRNSLAPYDLYSANATVRVGPKTALVVEAAQSTSTINTNPTNQTITPALANRSGEVKGDAWRIEFAHEDELNDIRLFAGRSSPAFNNAAAPLNGGRGELNAKASRKITNDISAYLEALSSEDRNDGGGKRIVGGAGVRWKVTDRLTLDAGVRVARETVGTQGNGTLTQPFASTGGLTSSIGTGSGGGALGFGNQQIDPTSGLPVVTQSGLANAVTDLPAGTKLSSDSVRLGAGYRISDRFTIGAEVEHDVSGDARRRESVGGDYQLFERTKLYGRYERQSGWVETSGVTGTGKNANAFVFGVDSSYLKETQIFSEYRLRDAVSGRDMQLASGIRNTWGLAEGIRVNTGYEHTKVLSGATAQADAVTAGIEYTANPLWKGSTRIEYRRSGNIAGTPDNEAFNTSLWQALIARKLARDWTLLGRNYLLLTRYDARGHVLQDRAQLGIAYRDTDTNLVNALAKIERKIETDASNAAVGELASRAWILSAHADYHPSRPWWFTGRVAGKWQRDRFENNVNDAFRAHLVAGRVVYDITENWDLGLLAATQFGQLGARQRAFGAEVGYLLQQNLWLSLGANVTGFRGDTDLAGYEYTQRGAYLRLRFKFDENLWRRGDPDTNRSLDR